MENGVFVFLGEINRKSRFFANCIEILASVNPESWPREKILCYLDKSAYDCLVYARKGKLIGALAFNPDRKENVLKVFLIFVKPEYRGRGIAKAMVAWILKWARSLRFKKTQVGLGGNPASVAVLTSLNKEKERFNLTFAEITPATGEVFFRN